MIDRDEISRRKLVGAVTELVGPGDMCCVSIVKREGLGKFSMISIDVPSRENATELVRALGLSAEQSALIASLGHQTTRLDVLALLTLIAIPVLGCALASCCLPSWSDLLFSVAVISGAISLPLAFLIFEFLFRTRITVGLDGFSRRTWRTREHVPFESIESITRTVAGAVVRLRNGASVHLFSHMSANQNAALGDLLYRRIWQAHFAHSELCKKSSTIDDVHTVGTRNWVRALRKNPEERVVSYRVAGRTLPHLEEALVDLTQPLQVRVAAAIALRAKDGSSAEPRILAAASASASPKLRVLFERIAEDASEEELAERIEAVV